MDPSWASGWPASHLLDHQHPPPPAFFLPVNEAQRRRISTAPPSPLLDPQTNPSAFQLASHASVLPAPTLAYTPFAVPLPEIGQHRPIAFCDSAQLPNAQQYHLGFPDAQQQWYRSSEGGSAGGGRGCALWQESEAGIDFGGGSTDHQHHRFRQAGASMSGGGTYPEFSRYDGSSSASAGYAATLDPSAGFGGAPFGVHPQTTASHQQQAAHEYETSFYPHHKRRGSQQATRNMYNVDPSLYRSRGADTGVQNQGGAVEQGYDAAGGGNAGFNQATADDWQQGGFRGAGLGASGLFPSASSSSSSSSQVSPLPHLPTSTTPLHEWPHDSNSYMPPRTNCQTPRHGPDATTSTITAPTLPPGVASGAPSAARKKTNRNLANELKATYGTAEAAREATKDARFSSFNRKLLSSSYQIATANTRRSFCEWNDAKEGWLEGTTASTMLTMGHALPELSNIKHFLSFYCENGASLLSGGQKGNSVHTMASLATRCRSFLYHDTGNKYTSGEITQLTAYISQQQGVLPVGKRPVTATTRQDLEEILACIAEALPHLSTVEQMTMRCFIQLLARRGLRPGCLVELIRRSGRCLYWEDVEFFLVGYTEESGPEYSLTIDLKWIKGWEHSSKSLRITLELLRRDRAPLDPNISLVWLAQHNGFLLPPTAAAIAAVRSGARSLSPSPVDASKGKQAVFCSQTHEPWDERYTINQLEHIAKFLGFEKLTHAPFRKAFATDLAGLIPDHHLRHFMAHSSTSNLAFATYQAPDHQIDLDAIRGDREANVEFQKQRSAVSFNRVESKGTTLSEGDLQRDGAISSALQCYHQLKNAYANPTHEQSEEIQDAWSDIMLAYKELSAKVAARLPAVAATAASPITATAALSNPSTDCSSNTPALDHLVTLATASTETLRLLDLCTENAVLLTMGRQHYYAFLDSQVQREALLDNFACPFCTEDGLDPDKDVPKKRPGKRAGSSKATSSASKGKASGTLAVDSLLGGDHSDDAQGAEDDQRLAAQGPADSILDAAHPELAPVATTFNAAAHSDVALGDLHGEERVGCRFANGSDLWSHVAECEAAHTADRFRCRGCRTLVVNEEYDSHYAACFAAVNAEMADPSLAVGAGRLESSSSEVAIKFNPISKTSLSRSALTNSSQTGRHRVPPRVVRHCPVHWSDDSLPFEERFVPAKNLRYSVEHILSHAPPKNNQRHRKPDQIDTNNSYSCRVSGHELFNLTFAGLLNHLHFDHHLPILIRNTDVAERHVPFDAIERLDEGLVVLFDYEAIKLNEDERPIMWILDAQAYTRRSKRATEAARLARLSDQSEAGVKKRAAIEKKRIKRKENDAAEQKARGGGSGNEAVEGAVGEPERDGLAE